MTTVIQTFLPPNSASPTIIAKGLYNGKFAYYKIFYNDTDHSKITPQINALLYEAHIYSFISKQINEYKEYFIPLLDIKTTTINDLIEKGIIKNKDDSILVKRMSDDKIKIDYTTKVTIIITEDTKSIPLLYALDMFKNDFVSDDYTKLKTKLSNIFNLVLNGIYTLNNNLQIQHNDMHFKNILIRDTKKFYDSSTTALNSNYQIFIYDFDRAYLLGKDNPYLKFLCEKGGGCNSLSNKDLFIFIQSLIIQYNNYKDNTNYSLYTRFLEELLNALVPPEHLELLKNNLIKIKAQKKAEEEGKVEDKTTLHWSSYCLHKEEDNLIFGFPCSTTEEQDKLLPWLNDIYKNFDKFTNDVKKEKSLYYYNKYLKYKNKYLQLKNLL